MATRVTPEESMYKPRKCRTEGSTIKYTDLTLAKLPAEKWRDGKLIGISTSSEELETPPQVLAQWVSKLGKGKIMDDVLIDIQTDINLPAIENEILRRKAKWTYIDTINRAFKLGSPLNAFIRTKMLVLGNGPLHRQIVKSIYAIYEERH